VSDAVKAHGHARRAESHPRSGKGRLDPSMPRPNHNHIEFSQW
jgi:hypothetical protein